MSKSLVYIKCKYCGITNELNSFHMKKCITNWDLNTGLKSCFSCGKTDQTYSSKQLSLDHKARCTNCIKYNKNDQYAPFTHLYKKILFTETHIHLLDIDSQLEYYTQETNFDKVKQLLESGANPNYCRQKTISNITDNNVLVYTKDGNKVPESDKEIPQPKTPLRMCVFNLTNCFATRNDLERLIQITKLLIEYGADKSDALTYHQDIYNGKVIDQQFYDLLK